MVQGELFGGGSSFESELIRPKSFLARHRFALSLDKIFLILIVFIFGFTISYSVGVEFGKRSVENKLKQLDPIQTQTLSTERGYQDPIEENSQQTLLVSTVEKAAEPDYNPSPEGPVQNLPVESQQTVSPGKSISSQVSFTETLGVTEAQKIGKYTVQLVTYDNKELAEKELNRLKSQGYQGFIIPSGRFFQVCANYFDSKSTARPKLDQLKQTGRYPDAYIRPVVR